MADREALRKMIRFHLATLGETNDHHRFELLCLDLTRARIAANVMPATGPVSAGGDQGRDAESYWSDLASNPSAGTRSSTARLIASENVVVACTLQLQKVPQKIAADIDAIVQKGEPVDRVVYFVSTAVPVGWRHQAQAAARSRHGIKLDIWDAQAISAELAEWDTFEIAATYLGVSTSLAPDKPSSDPSLPEWYQQDLARWTAVDANPHSVGDLIDIIPGIRRASVDRTLQRDLRRWLDILEEFIESTPDDAARLSARFEIVWAVLRGQGTVTEAAHHVREYMRLVLSDDFPDVDLLDKGSLLLDVAYGSWLDGNTDFERIEVEAWHDRMIAKGSALLAAGPYPTRRAILLALEARLHLHQRYPDPLPAHRRHFDPAEVAAVRHETGKDPARDFVVPKDIELRDIDTGMSMLKKLVELLPTAPLFPVTDTADVFNLYATRLNSHVDYPVVRDALDGAVERIEGGAARASRSLQRASRFLAADAPLDALHEVHEAKVNWWNGDTIGSAVEMLLAAAAIYMRLDLPLAAKQYALTAATVAQTSSDPHLKLAIANGFTEAGKAEHAAGQTLSAVKTMSIAALAQINYSDDPWNMERHGYLEGLFYTQALIYKITLDCRPTLQSLLEELLSDSGMLPLAKEWVAAAESAPRYTEASVRARAEEERLGLPFADLGPVRLYGWSALGIAWSVRTRNSKDDVLAAERIAAALQLLAAELGSRDAQLLSSPVNIEVGADLPAGVDPIEAIQTRDEPSGHWRRLRLSPRGADSYRDLEVETVSVVMHVLFEQSMLSQQDFTALLEDLVHKGLFHKLLAGRTYDDLADYLDDNFYADLSARAERAIAAGEPRNWSADGAILGRRTGVAAAYVPRRDQILRNIAFRYERFPKLLNRTLPMLLTNETFQATAIHLRDTGWKDWHLLIAVAGIAMNARAERRGMLTDLRDPSLAQNFRALYDEPETQDEHLCAPEEFDEEQLRMHLAAAAASGAATFGLSLNGAGVRQDELLEFLADRYRYWDDDVDHEPLLP